MGKQSDNYNSKEVNDIVTSLKDAQEKDVKIPQGKLFQVLEIFRKHLAYDQDELMNPEKLPLNHNKITDLDSISEDYEDGIDEVSQYVKNVSALKSYIMDYIHLSNNNAGKISNDNLQNSLEKVSCKLQDTIIGAIKYGILDPEVLPELEELFSEHHSMSSAIRSTMNEVDDMEGPVHVI